VSAALKLAVLGFPLDYTLSPALHRAGLEAIGMRGESEAVPTRPGELRDRLHGLATAGCRGANLTMPLKEAVIPHLARISEPARIARSVNTIGLGPEGWWGESTDGPGFVDLLLNLGRDPAGERVALIGGGAAARSLALALIAAGCADVTVAVRDPARAREAWCSIPRAALVAIGGAEAEALDGTATLLVDGTPAGIVLRSCSPRPGRLAIDLVYGPSVADAVRAARARGVGAHDGLGLLVHQARRSLSLWAGREVPLEPLARAVGWPR
jgi:shikimate dehydrogenase